MARSSAKKPGPAKCRGSSAQIEGRDWVRVGGNKWLREVAEQKGKFIPLEYRKEAKAARKAAAEAAEAAKAAKAAPAVEEAPAAVEAEVAPAAEEEAPEAVSE